MSVNNIISLFRQRVVITMLLFGTTLLLSCKKDWLDAKPDKSLVVPSSLQDYQAMLDNTDVFSINHPALGELSADNYYLLSATWSSLLSATERNAYTWAKDIYEGAPCNDWKNPYQQIFYSNLVLEGLQNISSSEIAAMNNCRGSALFHRAFAFHNLSQLFASPYNNNTAASDAGIPLKLTSDINVTVSRASVEETYQQIIKDLTEAIALLPLAPLYKTRPSKPAAYALLARVYLTMRDYDKAGLYADSSLQLYNTLIDYNTLNAAANNPLPRFNNEVIFHATMLNYSVFSTSRLIADTLLYASYNSNDLRKSCFYRTVSGNITFKGSYYGGSLYFNGLAVDEIMLVRAECFARKNKPAEAMNDLNALLQKRWKTGTLVPLTADNAEEALSMILIERRKELAFRGLRWPDLRRLNTEPARAVTLTRILNAQTYSLPPGGLKYVLPIPDDEINSSGIMQNPR